MKLIQTFMCTTYFVESHTTSGALSKNTFIVIMVKTRKLQISIKEAPNSMSGEHAF